MRRLVALMLDDCKILSYQFISVVSKQAFYLSVTVGNDATLAGGRNTQDNWSIFSVLAFAIRSAPAESEVFEVLTGLSSKLLSTFVIVAYRITISRVKPDVINSLISVLAQRFVLQLELFVDGLDLFARIIELVLIWSGAPEIIPEKVLLQSSLQDQWEEWFKFSFEGDYFFSRHMFVVHRLMFLLKIEEILLDQFWKTVRCKLYISVLLWILTDLQ
jgi:ABC-type uncharacterized transport system fused permease/ATPase subunit